MTVQANNFTTKCFSYHLSIQNISFELPPQKSISTVGVKETPAARG